MHTQMQVVLEQLQQLLVEKEQSEAEISMLHYKVTDLTDALAQERAASAVVGRKLRDDVRGNISDTASYRVIPRCEEHRP